MPNQEEILQNTGESEESKGYRKKLNDKFIDVQAKNSEVESNTIKNDNEMDALKQQFTKQLFDLMQEHGVDLDDINSINDFLTKLEQRDPDLKALFEMAFNNITGENLESTNNQIPEQPVLPEQGIPTEPPLPQQPIQEQPLPEQGNLNNIPPVL